MGGRRPHHAQRLLGYLSSSEAKSRAIETFERAAFLEAALERHEGNISATARALGLHRQSLQKMLKRISGDR